VVQDDSTAALIKLKNNTRPKNRQGEFKETVFPKQADTAAGAQGDPATYVCDRDKTEFPIGTLNIASEWVSHGAKIPEGEEVRSSIIGGVIN
jgi:hypothetical protein